MALLRLSGYEFGVFMQFRWNFLRAITLAAQRISHEPVQLAGIARDVQNVVLQCHRQRFAFQEEGWEDMTLQAARWMYACAARCAFPAGSTAQLSMWQSASALLRCAIAEQLSGSP